MQLRKPLGFVIADAHNRQGRSAFSKLVCACRGCRRGPVLGLYQRGGRYSAGWSAPLRRSHCSRRRNRVCMCARVQVGVMCTSFVARLAAPLPSVGCFSPCENAARSVRPCPPPPCSPGCRGWRGWQAACTRICDKDLCVRQTPLRVRAQHSGRAEAADRQLLVLDG